MTRSEAEKLLADFFARFGKREFAFDQTDFVKADIGEAILTFEYDADGKSLNCHALIYRFRQEPLPEVLEEARKAAKKESDTGGELFFDSSTLTLSLAKTYAEPVEPTEFLAQMQELAAASLVWSSKTLSRIADKVSGH